MADDEAKVAFGAAVKAAYAAVDLIMAEAGFADSSIALRVMKQINLTQAHLSYEVTVKSPLKGSMAATLVDHARSLWKAAQMDMPDAPVAGHG